MKKFMCAIAIAAFALGVAQAQEAKKDAAKTAACCQDKAACKKCTKDGAKACKKCEGKQKCDGKQCKADPKKADAAKK